MLIITLLDTQQMKPQQQWRFDKESIILVGRLLDNQVVLQSDLVSGIHLELHQIQPQQWQLISKGRNGTFVNNNAVQQIPLTDGMQVQLATGGPLLKFELQYQAASPPQTIAQPVISATPAANPQPSSTYSSTVALPAKPAAIHINQQQEIQQLTQEKHQLQLQLDQAQVARADLQTILTGINAQFPPVFFSQRQQEITTSLGEIQKLQTDLQAEIARLQRLIQQQPQSEQESLLKILSANSNYLEQERKSLEQFQEKMKNVAQLLDRLQKHLQANQNLSQQLPTTGTRVDNLVHTVTTQLTELDQEFGRIHEQHLLKSAKQTFFL